jgi:Ca2+-binding RTX toxin-like protein
MPSTATASGTITIDSSASSGGDFNQNVISHVAGLSGKYGFFGGTPDSAFGRTLYMNGSQIAYGELVDAASPDSLLLLEGEALAYDFIHYGNGSHGLSGDLSEIVIAQWVDGQTSGSQGTGAEGALTGFLESIRISGLDISVAPGTGQDPAINPLMVLFNALGGSDGEALFDFLAGYAQNFIGSDAADTYAGTQFSDTISGGGGGDRLDGGRGGDTISGGASRDVLLGVSGDDVLSGDAGIDVLRGGAGNDILNGGAGADSLNGAAGADELRGGTGADTFLFRSVADSTADALSQDTIIDFDGMRGDSIDVSPVDADATLADHQDFTFIGQSAFSGHAGELRFEADASGGLLLGDVNGDGAADFAVRLLGVQSLASTDLLI